MTILDRIGIDLGTPTAVDAPAMARAAADAGARIGRVRFALRAQSGVDEHVIGEATAVADALAAAGLRVIGVVDGGLTVAPEGLGDSAPDALAAAWAEELSQNAAALAGALGTRVGAWEILPAPNAPHGPRMSAARWAAAVDAVCRAVDAAAPDATRVAGGLWNDDADDGVDFLREAARAAGWSASRQPFDGLGIQLRLFRDGGPSEGTVAATLSERSQRLLRAAAAALGDEAIESLWVTGVAWDAVYAGESAQARNAWTALDTFTANPDVAAVVWSGLVDGPGATGLYASADLSPDHRRPAWRAFKDFALYAAQISPAPQILIHEPGETLDVTPGSGTGTGSIDAPTAPWPESDPSPAADETVGAADEAMDLDEGEEGGAWAWDAAPDEAQEDDTTGDVIHLEATGVDRLDAQRAHEAPAAEGETFEAAETTDVAVAPTTGEAIAPSIDDGVGEDEVIAASEVDERDERADWLDRAADEFDIHPTIVGASDRSADAPPPHVEVDDDAQSAPSTGNVDYAASAPVLWTIPPSPIEPEAAEAPGDDAQAAEASVDDATGDEALAASAPDTVTVRIPTLVDVLRGQGLDGQRLEAALRALESRAGAPGQLPPPGDYAIALAPAVVPAAAPGVVGGRTNQSVLSALYRAGGGRWTLLDRAGLDLTRLVTERTAAYDGPDVAALPGLSEAERQAVQAALG